jgi:hypothetical protein
MFNREERYIVFKLSDLGNSLKGDEIRRLAREYAEHRAEIGKPPLDCVVVESDWPEYEPTWKAIESRVNNELTPSEPKEQTNWVRVVDEALVNMCLGVANEDDSYEVAKNKLNELLAVTQDIATDPAVNGGYVLAPNFRGYALLGLGQYVIHICHEKDNDYDELVIRPATTVELMTRKLNELVETQLESIPVENIAVRIAFTNKAAIDNLITSLIKLRDSGDNTNE